MPRTYEEWLKVIVVVVRSERAVPWTKPEEFIYDAKDPSDGLVARSRARLLLMLEAGGVIVRLHIRFEIRPIRRPPRKSGSETSCCDIFYRRRAGDAVPPCMPGPLRLCPSLRLFRLAR